MRRCSALAPAAIVALATACGGNDGRTEEASRAQCSLVGARALEAELPADSVDLEPRTHQVSGDGTWCLYAIDGQRVELQFRPGDREQFDMLRAQALREGPAGFEDLPGIGDAAYRHAAGIPGVTTFVGSNLIVVQTLDRVPPEVPATLARLAVQACCPT